MISKRKGSVFAFFMVLVLTILLFPPADSSAKTKHTPNVVNGLTLKRNSKVLYIGGCKGKKADGTPAKLYRRVNVAKYYTGFNPDTMKLKMENPDKEIVYVSQKKHLIYAKKIGSTVVRTQVIDRASGDILYNAPFYITVKKNADADCFTVEGIEDSDEFEAGETVTVRLPGEYTDQRFLKCDDDSVEIVKGTEAHSYEVTFTEPGEFTIVAGAYQSKYYRGYTFTKKINVTVTGEEDSICQTGLHTVEVMGDSVAEDISPADIKVYEIVNGIDVFFSNVDSVTVEDDRAVITVFKAFEGSREYAVDFDGTRLVFLSVGTSVDDIDRIVLDIEKAVVGEAVKIPIRYYSKENFELTELYSSEWNSKVVLTCEAENMNSISFVNREICFFQKDIKAKLKGTLELPVSYASDNNKEVQSSNGAASESEIRILTAETEVVSVEKEKPRYTGTCIYTFKAEDGKYLTETDTVSHNIIIGDDVVFEALLLFSDGKYYTLKEAGITSILIADTTVLMQKNSLFGASGGIGLMINNLGTTSIIIYNGDEIVEDFDVSVLEKRHADRMEVSLSKNKLNSNFIADDYLIVKADVFDQYGALFDAGPVKISQPESNIKSVGRVYLSSVANGRLVINGTDCLGVSEGGIVILEISCGDYSEKKSFTVRDITYDGGKPEEFDITLKQEGPSLLDATLLKKDTEPDNVLFTVMVQKDGYYVTELSPELLKKRPNIGYKPQEYGIASGETMYGVLVERTPFDSSEAAKMSDADYVISEENDCIISSYLGLEFWAYQYGCSLESGTYSVTLYSITGKDNGTSVRTCGDSLSFKVIDKQPDIDVDQIAESAEISGSASWVTNIKQFFKFYLEGEDITQYVTNVTCNEASSMVFISEVEFRIPNRYYGPFMRTAGVKTLITKK